MSYPSYPPKRSGRKTHVSWEESFSNRHWSPSMTNKAWALYLIGYILVVVVLLKML